jgi:hypothetical protein
MYEIPEISEPKQNPILVHFYQWAKQRAEKLSPLVKPVSQANQTNGKEKNYASSYSQRI